MVEGDLVAETAITGASKPRVLVVDDEEAAVSSILELDAPSS